MTDIEQPHYYINDDEKRAYKTTYKLHNGKEESWTFEHNNKNKTINDQMTEDSQNTINNWLGDGYTEIKDIKEIKSLPLGVKVKYQLKDGRLRNGGVISKQEEKYMMLHNPMVNRRWSVQFDNLKAVYTKDVRFKKKKPESKNDIEEKEKILNEYYYEKGNMFGIDKLFKKIQDEVKDIKITREFIRKWIDKQDIYQITRNKRKTTSLRALVPTAPLKLIYIDLIDFSKSPVTKNGVTYNYVLNAVDGFTKYAWSIPIEHKEPKYVVKAFKEILNDPLINANDVKAVLSDNGGEFKGEFIDFLKNKNIKHIYSLPYSPNSNLTEIFNKSFKSYIFKSFLLNDNRDWITPIDKFVKNYNTTYHSSTEHTPIDAMLKTELKDEIYKNLQKKTKNIKDKLKYEIGDMVRLESYDKDQIKRKDGINFTKEIFEISKILNKKGLNPIRYKIKDLKGEDVTGVFTYNQLVLVPADTNYQIKEKEEEVVKEVEPVKTKKIRVKKKQDVEEEQVEQVSIPVPVSKKGRTIKKKQIVDV